MYLNLLKFTLIVAFRFNDIIGCLYTYLSSPFINCSHYEVVTSLSSCELFLFLTLKFLKKTDFKPITNSLPLKIKSGFESITDNQNCVDFSGNWLP